MAWYALINGNPIDAVNYRLLPNYTQGNPPSCSGGCIICAVFVTGDSPTPIFSEDLKDLIANGLVTRSGQRATPPPIPPPYLVLLRC